MIQQCSSVNFPELTNGTKFVSKKKHKRSEESESQKPSKRVRLAPEAEQNSTSHTTASAPKRVPVTKDPSGLFQIDSNPDDVEALIKKAEKQQETQRKQQARKEAKQKRKHQQEAEDVDVPLEVDGPDHELSASKRKKAKHSEITQEPIDGADDHDEDFEQKVVLRLKEKDEERKKKANKKRKRESEASVQESEAIVETESKQPKFKKAKSQPAVAKEVEPEKSSKAAKRKKRNSKDAGTAQDSPQQKPSKKERKKSA